MRNIESISEL